MQTAETVLGVLRERGRRGLPLQRLYRQLFNPHLYLLAYGRLHSNQGAMTPGADGETADGMSLATIEHITDALRHERYRFQPAKRVYIPKKNGKRRPLGLPSWSDKLVGEVVRLLLEAYYEPRFSNHSHGFRPGKGCHTALREVEGNWTGTTWFIEGDIADCFGSLDHSVMLSILATNIHDNRFLRLIKQILKAGYLEDWEYNATLSGAPQGGVASPILSNIYLDRLDRFVKTVLIPEHTRGASRAKNPAYREVGNTIKRIRQKHAYHNRKGEPAQIPQLRQQLRRLPAGDPHDPGYRRLRYVRYADDHLLAFTGPKAEAEEIKHRLAMFLRDDLKLELSQDKTLITHARTQRARFLGYDITVQHAPTKITRGRRDSRRSVNGKIRLCVPPAVIRAMCAPYCKRGKPAYQPHLLNRSDYDLIAGFGAQYRGFVQYYLLASDVYRLDRLKGVMLTSMLKTLATKHRSTVTTMARKHQATIATPSGPRRCFEARVERAGRKPLIARFGGIPLKRQRTRLLTDQPPAPLTRRAGAELPRRLTAGRCELCDSRTCVQVHQVRAFAELATPKRPQPAWARLMAKKRRKTLVVCSSCHEHIHSGHPTATPTA